jgi:hypothetical protein
VKIRFYLNPEYTGNLSVTLNGKVSDYYVLSGIVNNSDYIEVTIPATLINDQLVISDGVNSVSYGLYAYATAMNNTDYALQQMLMCMSEYASVAKIYAEG